MEKVEWADIHPFMSDEEVEEYIRVLTEREELEKNRFFYRPL